MVEEPELIGEEWTLASFNGAIHRGGVGLWAWSPTRRLAQLDSLCRAFWGMTEAVVPIDELFARVNAEDRDGMIRDWMASADDPHAYSFDFRIGDGPEARWISAGASAERPDRSGNGSRRSSWTSPSGGGRKRPNGCWPRSSPIASRTCSPWPAP